MSPLWFANASTMSFPLWSVCFLISIPWAEKKPFVTPRSIGSAFAIGSVSTVIVVSVARCDAPDAEPPRPASKPSTQATKATLRCSLILLPPLGGLLVDTCSESGQSDVVLRQRRRGRGRRRDVAELGGLQLCVGCVPSVEPVQHAGLGGGEGVGALGSSHG